MKQVKILMLAILTVLNFSVGFQQTFHMKVQKKTPVIYSSREDVLVPLTDSSD